MDIEVDALHKIASTECEKRSSYVWTLRAKTIPSSSSNPEPLVWCKTVKSGAPDAFHALHYYPYTGFGMSQAVISEEETRFGRVPYTSEVRSCSKPTVFISQIQEGFSYNKYLQIYNPTADEVHLDGFSIASCHNECGPAGAFEYVNRFAPGAKLPSMGTYTVCHNSLGNITHCDNTTELYFNGNDVVAIVEGTYDDAASVPASKVVDQVGIATAESTDVWQVCGQDARFTTRDVQMRRCGVACGDASGQAFDGTVLGAYDCPWTSEMPTSGVEDWSSTDCPTHSNGTTT